MNFYLQQILDWSEVWAVLIPLTVYFIKKPKSKWIRPVLYYLIIALVLNLCADLIWKRRKLGIEPWMQSNIGFFFEEDGTTFKNAVLYNIHSISRFLLFGWFFTYIATIYSKLNRIIIPLFILAVLVNFIFFESILGDEVFSSRLFTVEAALLLLYCIIYYFMVLRDERIEMPTTQPSFWLITGLSIYVAINFFIWLFYSQLTIQFKDFAVSIWDYHNISYIIFCIFIAIAFWKDHER